MRFLNPNERVVEKIRVDGCALKEGKKCDFMLKTDSDENYIEIKGKGVLYACEQIEETIKKLSVDVKGHTKNSFVVSTGTPKVTGKIQVLKKKFKSTYNSSLKIQTRQCQVAI
ncbi:hypothetical protein [Algoriphagus marincola]|uniref:hypothetical protein n=1 Tax=Algoriphagus marincola TaxID=264027 RepID=UPI00138ABD23|nr:hypothetical protein [Algoriphagus marincola]